MRILKIVLFNVLLLVFLLILLEVLLWQLYPNYQFYYRSHPIQPDLEQVLAKGQNDWLQSDSLLGWVCQRKATLYFPSPPRPQVSYQINKEGFRNQLNFNDSTSVRKKKILLIGDSFFFGIYLSEEETIAAKLEENLGEDYTVFNLSVPAWGVDQMYLAYQKYINIIQPDQIVFGFVDDDLMRSLEILFHGCGRKPCLKIENNQLVENNDNPHWWEYLCWNNQIGNRLLVYYYQKKALRLTTFMFEDIIENEKQSKRSPIFIRIPAQVDLLHSEPRNIFDLTEMMKEEEVVYLSLYDSLKTLPEEKYKKLYIPDDGHFTEEGTSLMVRYLQKEIN